ncbi:uncharacterized protein BX663DRAFT_455650 [Cokeromyces recurvatus]|uniref:uncharacterized protein n=1 Tax=Cokeromyces recurvatus TaxID=90255 RepID=UPI00222129D2|nr:uncharacterized protein BX663DRAFT_455650 [Cokeromyces recurvatus]KAI7902110.1 hypothetical protein BX663DRAFT_455650 [Cokeromyces recurvatus]
MSFFNKLENTIFTPTLYQKQSNIEFQDKYLSKSLLREQKSGYKSDVELPGLCSFIIQALCGGNLMWDIAKFMNFTLFCNQLLTELNIPISVVYTSLKYFQQTLANSINKYNIIDLSDIAHEYSLFTVTLLIAYKFLEDNPPHMKQWSYVSMISMKELVLLEAQILKRLNHSLNISLETFNQWAKQCNTIYEIMINSSQNIDHQLISIFDLHMTQSRLGYCTLLPVLLSDDFSYSYGSYSQLALLMTNCSNNNNSSNYSHISLTDYSYFDDNTITPYYYNDVVPQDHYGRYNIPPWLQEIVPVLIDHS